MENFKVKAELEINVTQEDIDDIVTTAMEGGINYWCKMEAQYCTKINELEKQISDDGLALNSMNAQMGLMRNKAAGEIEELLKRANEAERKLAVLKEAFAIITGKEAE